ncbi:unnamed protein product [Ambrosiozyma monospora]|uniref:Unnamed protein product n=1 Tax=Ambrosiozyma monospora TaxID=43982 RepID=A0A9W6Z079_AMBMO|nr:unnamed protein product [Ambrosiozyma monospora]
MFSSLFQTIGFAVGFVYPLNETYKILQASQKRNSELGQQLLQQMSGQATLTIQDQANLQRWFTYWLVVALFQFIKATKIVVLLTSLVPFQDLVFLYLRIWLVAPLAEVDGVKYTGSEVLYQFYLSRWLAALNVYMGNFNLKDVTSMLIQLYNHLITNYLPQFSYMKMTDPNGSNSAAAAASAGSFGSSSVPVNEMGFKDIVTNMWYAKGGNSSRSSFASQSQQQQFDLYNELVPQVLLEALLSPITSTFRQGTTSSASALASGPSSTAPSRSVSGVAAAATATATGAPSISVGGLASTASLNHSKSASSINLLEGFDFVSKEEASNNNSQAELLSFATAATSNVIAPLATNAFNRSGNGSTSSSKSRSASFDVKKRVTSNSSVNIVTPPVNNKNDESSSKTTTQKKSWFGW